MKKFTITIKSKLVPWRGNSWYFESPKERVYFKKDNPSPEEISAAVAEAKRQYEAMGWMRCFVEPPVMVTDNFEELIQVIEAV